jgi:3-oxoacyl-[acyl-carrier protein] reductase
MSKIILITGASTGIGAATAIHLAPGNQVIVHYNTSKNEAEKVAEEINARGGTAHLIQANLATADGCKNIAQLMKDRWGKLDVLINNAGGLIKQHRPTEITWDFLEKLFDLNTFSVMYLSSLCVPLLQRGEKPCVVNITSAIIRSGGTVGPIYAAAKGAVDVFTRSLARDLAPLIRVNAVAPGVIRTPFHEGVTPDEKMQEVIAMTPLKKIGEPEDIAKVVAMLIDNEFMTGETVDVNGGLYMR